MLTELQIDVETDENYRIGSNKGSIFQGLLMQQVDPEYGELLHMQGIKPYSQYVKNDGDKTIWHIFTLNKEAYEKIILPIYNSSVDEFKIEHDNETIKLSNKRISSIPMKQLMDDFYGKDAGNIYDIEFVTPTAFKRDGKYSFYPEMYAILNSIMKKMDKVSDQSMFNTETLDQLTDNANIINYNLKSVFYSVEGIKIPSFVGRISVKLQGSQTMNNFAKMLFEFGNYSGVGIKTAMGMGAVKIKERKKG